MDKAACFSLGHIAKLHGYKGEVSLFFDTDHPDEYANLDAFFIELNGILTPFFIESLTFKNNGFAKVKLEGIDSEVEAKQLLKQTVYLPLEILPALTGTHFYDHEVIHFKVIDKNYGEIGEIKSIIDNASNPLIQIWNSTKQKEVLLPLHQEFILEVNREKKQIIVEALPGLIEMYLED